MQLIFLEKSMCRTATMRVCQFQVWAREYCLSGGKSFLSPTTLTSYEFFSHALRSDWSGQMLRSPKWLGIQISRIIRHPGAGLECKFLQESSWLASGADLCQGTALPISISWASTKAPITWWHLWSELAETSAVACKIRRGLLCSSLTC